MKREILQGNIKTMGRINIELAQLRAGLAELDSFGHLYDKGASLVKSTRIAMEIKISRLELRRNALIA